MPPKELDPTASLAHLLGAKVRKLRTERGWSQAELGMRVFVAETWLESAASGESGR